MTNSQRRIATEGGAPFFSVVIPTYQRAELLVRAVRSVLMQTCTDLEIVVQDDGSTDETEHLLRRLGDPRVRYRRQEHLGRGAARNAGASRARGRFIAFLDSDDEAEPNWLSRFAGVVGERTGLACCGIRVLVEGHAGQTRDGSVDLPRTMRPLIDVDGVLIRAGTFVVLRRLFLEIGGYAEQLRYSENTELSFRLIPHCLDEGLEIKAVPEPLVRYHQHRSRPDAAHYRKRLEACEYLIHQHHTILAKDPLYYARYHRIAAANAVRLGQFARARQHFLRGFRLAPAPRDLAGAAITLVPGLRSRVWKGAWS